MVNVDVSLRRAQVVLHLITICSGLMTGIGLGWTVQIFSENCLLYSNMVLSQDRNKTIILNSEDTEWGAVEICYYCVFSPVMTAIYCIIWFWFYILISNWDNSLDFKSKFSFTRPRLGVELNQKPPPDVKLFVPTLLLFIVLFISTMVSLGMLTAGSRDWCHSAQHYLGKQCSYLTQEKWNVEYGETVYTYVRVAQAGSWILLLSLFAKIVILAARIHLHYRIDVAASKQQNRTGSSKTENKEKTKNKGKGKGKKTLKNKDYEECNTGESESEDDDHLTELNHPYTTLDNWEGFRNRNRSMQTSAGASATKDVSEQTELKSPQTKKYNTV